MITGYVIEVGPTADLKEDEYSAWDFTCTQHNLLKTAQDIVGGPIEHVPSENTFTFYVNEDGKNINLPRNYLAEKLWAQYDKYGCLADGQWIAGNMVIFGPPTPGGYTTSAPLNTWDILNALVDASEEHDAE